MTNNHHKQRKLPKLPFQQTEPNEPAGSVSQPVQMVEKRFQNISEPSLQSQEFEKINGVQFRLRMTKNQHKRSKLPKLPFQQTEFNEPANLVSQPVQTVERGSQNLSDHSSKSHKSKKNKPSRKQTPNDLELIQTAPKTRTTVSANLIQ